MVGSRNPNGIINLVIKCVCVGAEEKKRFPIKCGYLCQREAVNVLCSLVTSLNNVLISR